MDNLFINVGTLRLGSDNTEQVYQFKGEYAGTHAEMGDNSDSYNAYDAYVLDSGQILIHTQCYNISDDVLVLSFLTIVDSVDNLVLAGFSSELVSHIKQYLEQRNSGGTINYKRNDDNTHNNTKQEAQDE